MEPPRFLKERAPFMESTGYRLVSDDKTLAIKTLNDLLTDRKGRTDFVLPGPFPVSLNPKALETLYKKDYFVCEKNDGERVCLMFTRLKGIKICIGFNRNEDVFIMTCSDADRELYDGTLLDAEVVRDANKKSLRMVVFDCMAYCGRNTEKEKFADRIQCAIDTVKRIRYVPNKDTAQVSVKPVFKFTEFDRFLEYFHEASDAQKLDGIIFIPNHHGVVYARHRTMYKWKSAEDHTVDFQMGPDRELLVYNHEIGKPVQVGMLTLRRGQQQPLADSIVECKLVDRKADAWEMVKVRTDKFRSNDYRTYASTLETIDSNISQSKLLLASKGRFYK